MIHSEPFLTDRRKHPRHPIEAQVTVLFPDFWQVDDLDRLLGWTHDVSEGGVSFSLPYRIANSQLILHIDYEGIGAEYVLVNVIRQHDLNEAGWRYHCQIERTLSSIDAMECLQEATAGLTEYGLPSNA